MPTDYSGAPSPPLRRRVGPPNLRAVILFVVQPEAAGTRSVLLFLLAAASHELILIALVSS